MVHDIVSNSPGVICLDQVKGMPRKIASVIFTHKFKDTAIELVLDYLINLRWFKIIVHGCINVICNGNAFVVLIRDWIQFVFSRII